MIKTQADNKCRGYAEEAAQAIGRGFVVQMAFTEARDPTLCIVELGTSPEHSFTCKFRMVGDEKKNREALMHQVNEKLKTQGR